MEPSGSMVGLRTDLWAVGATLFALLAGQRPRRAATVNEELLAAMTQPLPPIATVVPSVPPELGMIIDRACAFEISQRWPTARMMQLALRETAARLHLTGEPSIDTAPVLRGQTSPDMLMDARVTTSRPTVDPSLSQPVPSPKRSVITAVAVFVGVVALGVGGAFVFLYARKQPAALAAPDPLVTAATATTTSTATLGARPAATETAISVESLPAATPQQHPVKPTASTTATAAQPHATAQHPPAKPGADMFDTRF